jgi:transposase
VDYQPRPRVHQKKARRDRLIRLARQHPDWALGFEDEVWWSRVSQPAVRTWMDPDQPLRLQELDRPASDTAPKALACYGLLARWWAASGERQEQVWLRFVDGRPVSAITTPFLAWCCAKLAAQGQRALLLVWDNASWHVSQAVRQWIRAHNRQVKQTGQGVRIVKCYLPIKSPWLNPIEPKWVYGKRRMVEPDRVLTPTELAERVCEVFGCPYEDHLSLSKEVA